MKTKELTLQSERNRKRLIEIIYKAKAGHIGGDLSCLNVLTALYFDVMNVNADSPKDDLRDRFILSKGHCVEALYVTLESKGFITEGIWIHWDNMALSFRDIPLSEFRVLK